LNSEAQEHLQTAHHTEIASIERAGYFHVSGAHLYTVLHEVPDPVARVLLVGPFASERHNSYLPWVRWARYLAARRIEVLRYDYRGVGESTGVFEEMTFDNWTEDVQLLADWLSTRSPVAPLILHGLELGALLAARIFDSGRGGALLLWSPPATAHQALRSTLLRWVGLEHLFKSGQELRSAAEYIHELEDGSFVEVEGYRWSSRLWRDSFNLDLPTSIIDNNNAASPASGRPIRIIKLDRHAAPLVKGGFVGYDEAKDFSWLFAPNSDWIAASTRGTREAS
jgi:pimeloyl-ACP methyl ester carboxylesterase